jgi:hypothetical protein
MKHPKMTKNTFIKCHKEIMSNETHEKSNWGFEQNYYN